MDDCSDSETSEKLETLQNDRIKLITNSSNLGYAKSNNIGAQNAQGEFLVLANNDLEFPNGWLEPILKGLKKETIGIVGNIQTDTTEAF